MTSALSKNVAGATVPSTPRHFAIYLRHGPRTPLPGHSPRLRKGHLKHFPPATSQYGAMTSEADKGSREMEVVCRQRALQVLDRDRIRSRCDSRIDGSVGVV